MQSYLLSFLWGIVILLSLIGWGSVINRVFFSNYPVDWGQRAAWGVAFSIFVGGILNLTWAISKITIVIYLTIGFLLYWLFYLSKTKQFIIKSVCYVRDYKKDKILLSVFAFIVFTLIFLRYADSVSCLNFNTQDDFQGYFIFPNKMLQTGSMGADPFCERRVVSSLGGQSFLHTFVLSMLSEKNLNIIDPGVALLIVIGLLLGYSKIEGLSKKEIMFILTFFILIPLPKANITALMTPCALFISFSRILDWKGLRTNQYMVNAFIIALLAAAICSLKSSLISACGILFVSSYLFYISDSRPKKKAICEFFTAIILVIVFLLPWMISMYQSSGTLLYPLLGKGYHGTTYGVTPSPWHGLTIAKVMGTSFNYIVSPYFVLLAVLGFISIRPGHLKPFGRGTSVSLLISAGLGALVFLTITRHSERFVWPFMVAAIIILMIKALVSTRERSKSKFILVLISVFLAGMIIGNGNFSLIARCRQYRKEVISQLKDIPLIANEDIVQYKEMQLSIPENEKVLAYLRLPFLLDFSRNQIYVVDDPGNSSLPPGIPLFKGPEALADYLISKSIRYLAYSYADEAGFPKKSFGIRLSHPDIWLASATKNTFNFQDSLVQLGNIREKVYDNGKIFVLDLLKSLPADEFLLEKRNNDKDLLVHTKFKYEVGTEKQVMRFAPPILKNEFTIEILVKPAQVTFADIIISNHPGYNWYEGFVIQQDGDNQNDYLFFYGDGENWGKPVSFKLNKNQWNYLAIRVCENIVKLYLNGKFFAPVDTGRIIKNSQHPLDIGNWYRGDLPFSGWIREVRISNNLISDDEISKTWSNIQRKLKKAITEQN